MSALTPSLHQSDAESGARPEATERTSTFYLIIGARRSQSVTGSREHQRMSHRRNDRWEPPEPDTLPAEARGGPERTMTPPADVRAWVQLGNRLVRIEGRAVRATDDAVLVEWGERSTRQSAWVWRSAVKRLLKSD